MTDNLPRRMNHYGWMGTIG